MATPPPKYDRPLPETLPKLRPAPYPRKASVAAPNVNVTLIRNKEGNVRINEAKRYLRPYWLATQPGVVTLPSQAVDNRPSAPIIMPIDNQGPVEIYYSMFESTGDFALQIFDPNSRRILMNREVHIRTIAGTGQAPLIWKEPLLLHPGKSGRALVVQFWNLTDAENNIRFTLHGRRMWRYESPRDVIKAWEGYAYKNQFTHPYFLTTDTDMTSTGAGAEFLTEFIRNPDDSDFEWFKSAAATVNFTNPGVEAPYLVEIEDKSNQRKMMNGPIHNLNIFGGTQLSPTPTGILPFNLWESMFFERNYEFQVEITEFLADAQRYYLTLHGRKIHHDES